MEVRRYRIVVEGELADRFAPALGATELRREEGNTVVECLVHDQAQLHGLLQRVASLGMTLLSVTPADS